MSCNSSFYVPNNVCLCFLRVFPHHVYLAVLFNLDTLKEFPVKPILDRFAQLYTAFFLLESGVQLE